MAAISSLEIRSGAVVYDIGSGTGSIAVECAMLSPDIKVYAFECNEKAQKLLPLQKHLIQLEKRPKK